MPKPVYEIASIQKKDGGATIEIRGRIPLSEIERITPAVIQKLAQGVDIPGFRRGRAPLPILIEKLGVTTILEKVAQQIFAANLRDILTEAKTPFLGSPRVEIGELAEGLPIEFVVEAATRPSFTLPSWRETAAKAQSDAPHEDTAVSDAEVEHALELLQQEGRESKGPFPDSEEELRRAVRHGLERAKARAALEKKRAFIAERLIAESTMTLSPLLIEHELSHMRSQFVDDLTKHQYTLDRYLSGIKKTEEELLASWKPEAEKRLKLRFILDAIATEAGIVVSPEEVEEKMATLSTQEGDADPAQLKNFVALVLRNEKIFSLLETEP